MRILLIILLATAGAAAAASHDIPDQSEPTTLNGEDKARIETAMKRTADGASVDELERLPLPTNEPFTAANYALEFPAAWIPRSAALEKRDEAVIALQMLAANGGHLYYAEWACETGKEQVVAAQVVGLLPRLVTKYVERMLLSDFILARHLRGYDIVKRCSRDELSSARKIFEPFYVTASKLAVEAAEQK